MGLHFFTSLLLSWVCLSLSIGAIMVFASLGQNGRNHFGSRT
jgi:hypothetical protein